MKKEKARKRERERETIDRERHSHTEKQKKTTKNKTVVVHERKSNVSQWVREVKDYLRSFATSLFER